MKGFKLSCIEIYEEDTGKSILDYFGTVSVKNILELISLGNLGNLGNGELEESLEESGKLLDAYLKHSGNSLISAMKEIKDILLGTGGEEDEFNRGTGDSGGYGGDSGGGDFRAGRNGVGIDGRNEGFNSLTDIYNHYYIVIRSITEIGYAEFWGMNTRQLYRELNNIETIFINRANIRLQEDYRLSAMIGASVWGKLEECPRIEAKKKNEELGTDALDYEDLRMVANLKAFAAINSKGGVQ